MGLFSSINTAASGLTAQRLRQDVIADNIANANTTRTTEGGPYRRSRVVLRPRTEGVSWRSPFVPRPLDEGVGKGVRVTSVEKDMDAELRLVYDPTHPDAIQSGPREGYVEYPNVTIVSEMVDLIDASRAYEANVAVVNGARTMFQRALEIGR
ncbi:flagellar basal-body rod protein FlgC [Alkalispirochaeta sphaeroplastigenens]|uniref:Flagellar basal-body rod protein FlgC n=1 Tax=Alkalispirochaeta sphaeroplastigenens TaxID=1187066 RepID=A0A2S4JYZ5_9SPIO|nr:MULTISPECIES: flagellar basal body rod protein FlgC [Alkalispirochaeta]POR04729.1 flagellar basal-body rod protein FlgC [Alkalispirochaeta sphaeroplastigenens]